MTEINNPSQTSETNSTPAQDTNNRRRWFVVGGAVIVAALIGITLAITLGRDNQTSPGQVTDPTPQPTTATAPSPSSFTDPAALAEQFASDYASGDTPAAALLASGDALTSLTEHGWDQQNAPWSASITPVSSCSLPAQSGAAFAAVYMTSTLVDGHRGVEVAVKKTDNGYTVSKVYARAEQSLCSIYGGGGG